jgi:phage baseplate assembly protein V
MVSPIRRMLEPLERRVRGMVRRFVLASLSDDGAAAVTGKGLAEDFDGAELLEQYGFTSRPESGADGVSFAVNGNQDNTVAFVYDRRHRPKGLEGGDACMYSKGGNKITVAADETITIENESGARITMTPAGNVEIEAVASIKLDGDTTLALNPDLKAYSGALAGFWGTFVTWATAATGVWADDLIELKGQVSVPAGTALTTLVPQIAATPGAAKGKG